MNTVVTSEVALALALELAEPHVRDVASMGGQAHPSDADECFEGFTLSRALRDAGVADWNDESNIEALRSMLRRTIGQLLDEGAAEREEYTATLRAEQNAAIDADREHYETVCNLKEAERIRAEDVARAAYNAVYDAAIAHESDEVRATAHTVALDAYYASLAAYEAGVTT